ncbi:Uncharacterised protein [Mycobacteroides abscessus subsp. abscessus]|nr:Uncharacterised protein [Mycobacteroides abscessus subsp. abscessus]
MASGGGSLAQRTKLSENFSVSSFDASWGALLADAFLGAFGGFSLLFVSAAAACSSAEVSLPTRPARRSSSVSWSRSWPRASQSNTLLNSSGSSSSSIISFATTAMSSSMPRRRAIDSRTLRSLRKRLIRRGLPRSFS